MNEFAIFKFRRLCGSFIPELCGPQGQELVYILLGILPYPVPNTIPGAEQNLNPYLLNKE